MGKSKIMVFLCLAFIIQSAYFTFGSAAGHESTSTQVLADFDKNIRWLESMVRRVKIVEKEYALVQSYENLDDRCWVYDQALAIMCFVATRRIDLSRIVLDTLNRLQNPDGSFYFSYKISTLEPTSERKYTGSVAWVAMAVNLYREFTSDTAYNVLLWRIMNWLCSQQVMDEKQPSFGGISLGVRNDAFSTEHNLDTYSAFTHYHNRYFRKRARLVKNFIMNQLYQKQEIPYFITGFNDFSIYLDCQSWSVLALGHIFCPVLQFAEANFRVENGSLNSETGIRGFFETRVETAPVWSEGTEGMALAHFLCGNPEKGKEYHRQVKRMMGKKGGIAYSTENDCDFSTSPSVAGTAWYIFYELKLNPFRPGKELVRSTKKFMGEYEAFLRRSVAPGISRKK
jgi:hypothetical protein